MQVSELKAEFDTEFPAGAVTDAEKLRWFNIACLDINRKTYCIKSSWQTWTVADQREYSLPDDCMMIDPEAGIEWKDSNGKWQQLTRKSILWLKQNNSDWRNSSSGSPQYYYQRGQIFGFEPPPSTAGSEANKNIKIYGIDKPNVLSADADTPLEKDDALEDYHPLIVTFALWKAKQKRGKFSQAREFKTEYYEGLAVMKAELEKKPDYRPHWEADGDYFTWHA